MHVNTNCHEQSRGNRQRVGIEFMLPVILSLSRADRQLPIKYTIMTHDGRLAENVSPDDTELDALASAILQVL